MAKPTPIISVSLLQRAAETYNAHIAQVPVLKIAEVAAALKINVVSLIQTYNYLTLERKGGLLTPYALGKEIVSRAELGRMRQMPLNMYRSYIETVDDITRYDFDDKKQVLVNGGQPVDLAKGKHPLEAIILFNMASTMSEDVINNLFFGEHDETSNEAHAAFDGFYTIINALIAAGEVAEAKGNLVASGELTTPVDGNDTSAFDNLLKWLLAASPKLRSGKARLRLSDSALLAVTAAYGNKVKYTKDPTIAETITAIKEKVMAPNLEVLSHVCLGSGSKLTLSGEVEDPREKDLFSFGISTDIAAQMVQVRDINKNPNLPQFFAQAAFGTCVKTVGKHLFMTNEQQNTGINLSGDY